MEVLRRTDLWGGIMCAVIGAVALWLMADLRMGSAAAMGPGFTPVWLARILLGLGLLIAAKSFAGSDLLRWRWQVVRPVATVLGVIVFYALALPLLGFALTSFLLLLVAGAAGQDFRPREAVIIAVIGALASTVLFIFALKLNIAAWPL